MTVRPPAHTEVSRGLRGRAKSMRSGQTLAERRFWQAVRAHRFKGLLFRRQVPVAGDVVDFACHEHRLIVEIDGATHSTGAERAADALRSNKLEAEGYRVLRFCNDDIARNLPGVLDRLADETGGWPLDADGPGARDMP